MPKVMRFKVKDQFRFYRNDNWIASIGVASEGYRYCPKCDNTQFELGQWVYPSENRSWDILSE